MVELTPWFPIGSRPATPGVYQREFPNLVLYAEWTGHQWLTGATTPRKAARRREVSQQQDTLRWRGLAASPFGVKASAGWCGNCGEGIPLDPPMCRGKSGECPHGFPKPGTAGVEGRKP